MTIIDPKLRAAERHASLSRRHFLRGLGTCLALPMMDSLLSSSARAAEIAQKAGLTATGAPLRSLFLFFPNGAIPGAWWPESEGANFSLNRTMQPLAAHQKYMQVLGGLNHDNASPGPDGAGDHARGNSTFLTGVRLKKSATDIRAGISIDQVIAKEIGHLTRFPSLELGTEARRGSGACDSGYSCAYQFNLSWSSATTPMAPEANPRLVFERLFGAGAPGERAGNLKRVRDEQRSLLDYVLGDAKAMATRLDARDKDKLDQYLTGIREVEQRIQKAEKFGDAKDPGIATPDGIPSNIADHIQLMSDMIVLAFQTDSTRVATFQLAHDGSNRSFADIGVPEGHHDLTHHFENPEKIEKVTLIDIFYAQQLAKLLDKLAGAKDLDGNSLLHNSMVVYGGGNADANRHTHSNLPVILAGGGGGSLQSGRFIKHGSVPMSNLFLSMADRMGVQNLERFGDSTGRLSNI